MTKHTQSSRWLQRNISTLDRDHMHAGWSAAHTQARHRKEPWSMTFDDWCVVWADHWHQRGRDSDSLCMTRCDVTEPWSRSNVCLITRQQLGQRRTGSGRGADLVLKTYSAPEADFVLPMAPQVPQRLGGRRVQYRRP